VISIAFVGTSFAAHAQQTNAAPRAASFSAVLDRFGEVLVGSARTYLRIEDAELSILAPPVPLINRYNLLDRHYRPERMVNISNYVRTTRSPLYLEENAANAYIKMAASMQEDGIIGMAAVSGFRDWDHQSRIHNAEVDRQSRQFPREEARRRAQTIVAPPGASEHQSGLAVDVSSAEIGFSLSSRFENTASFRWLSENAHTYGFIIRYPRDSMEITGVIFEPWHLRYVGVDHATRMFESGILTLEEYLESYMIGAWSE